MSIRRLPSGSYQARVMIDGVTHSETLLSEQAARDWLLLTHQWTEPPRAAVTTLGSAVVSRASRGTSSRSAIEEGRVTEDEREELTAVLRDLSDEEADQQAERGHASSRLLRATARLSRLLEHGSGGSVT